MIHLIFAFAGAAVDFAHARPRPAPLVAAVGLATLVAGCDAPEHQDCLSDEIAQRTLRLTMDSATCSGVLVTPRVIRTAAHCFWRGGGLRAVFTKDGRELTGRFAARYTPEDPSGMHFDQAEIVADRDLVDVAPLPIVQAAHERAVIAVGYPHGGEMLRSLMRVTGTYQNLEGRPGLVIYELDGDAGWTAIPGESGGPLFAANRCELLLVGTLTSATSRVTYVQGVRPIAPAAAVAGGAAGGSTRGAKVSAP